MHIFEHVFSPLKIGNITVKNRIEVPPMLSCMATSDGFVTREMIEFYQPFARGGAGIVTIGDSAIDYENAVSHFGQLNLGDDRVITGLSNLVEAIEKYGAKASIELDHSGRLSSPKVLRGKSPIGPSPIPSDGEKLAAAIENRPVTPVIEMDQKMIDRVISNFADACLRCLKAGFSMVMLHGGHGQLLSQFVSPSSNKRTDKYGGSLENRARFVLEVLDSVRAKVGRNLVIEYRISGDELIPDGLHEDETIKFLQLIQDKIDLVHISLGNVANPRYIPYMSQPTYFPHAFNVERAYRIKRQLKIPVTAVGSIMDLHMADKIIADGKADIVAMGRAHIADPDIVNKTLRGEFEEIRPCLRCGTCGERPKDFFPVRCAVNPVSGREIEYKRLYPATRKRRILIAGGGPAGMQAAITASRRGHDVILFEKSANLGGSLIAAAAPDFKPDMKRFLNWLIYQTEKSSISLNLKTEISESAIKQIKPDVLIIAIGARPYIPQIPGINSPQVFIAADVDTGKVATGKSVIVAGAGLTGCETALYLAQKGKAITLIDILPHDQFARDASLASRLALLELLEKYNVRSMPETELKEITDFGVRVTDRDRKTIELEADSIVLALGVVPDMPYIDRLRKLVNESYLIGDCARPRNLMAAIHDAFNLTAEI